MGKQTRTVIEITGRQIKLTQTAWRGNLRALTRCAIVDIQGLPDEALPKQLADLDKTQKLRLSASEVVVVIPRQHAILRYINLPSQNLDELSQMVDLQAVNHIPYAREDVVVDFMVLNMDIDGYSKVLVIVVPKEVVLRLVRILEMAKVPLHRAVMSSIGIFYWHRDHCLKDAGAAVVLDIGGQESEICICDEKHLFISRHVPVGIKEFEAQQAEEFLKQIDLTVESYRKEKLGPPFSRISLYSSMEGMKYFYDRLSKEYTIPVEYIRTIDLSVPIVKSFQWPKGLLAGGPSVTVGLGLGLGDLSKGIDLIPREIKEDRDNKKAHLTLIRVSIVGLMTLVALFLAVNLETMHKSLYLKKLEGRLEDAKAKVAQSQKKSAQVNAIKSTLEGRFMFMDAVDEIYRFMPSGISLVNLSVSNGCALSLQGVSHNGEDINRLQKAMVDSLKFSNVNLEYMNKRTTQDGEINYFKITFQARPAGS